MKKFTKEIDLYSPTTMTEFLKNHTRYFTGSEVTGDTSYANDVSINNISIPDTLREKAEVFATADTSEYDDLVKQIKEEFHKETGCYIVSNGNYFVLLKEKTSKAGIPIIDFSSFDHNEDYASMSTDELSDRVKLVTAFDTYCDEIVDLYLYYLFACEIVKVEETIIKKHCIARLKKD